MWNRAKNVRIRTITYVLVGLMVLAGVAIATALAQTSREVGNAKAAWDDYAAVTIEKINARAAIRDAIGLGGFVSAYKDGILKKSKTSLNLAVAKAQQALDAVARFRALQPTAGETSALAAIEEVLHRYNATIPTISQWIDLGADIDDLATANPIDDRPLERGLTSLDLEITKAKNSTQAAVVSAVDRAGSNVLVASGIVAALIIAIIAAFLWVVRSRVVRPVDRLMDFSARIGRGELTAQLTGMREDEIGKLGAEMNTMVTGLRNIAVQTRSSAASLNSAATETLASTKQQAASVEQQFAAIQETTATLDEINASGQQMTGRAREIAAEAEKAQERSKDGLKAMDDMAQVMDAIEEQTESVAAHIVALSEKTQAIGDIISTVNDIAERSQLLALNAAIEAAAAGEGGRSFSVVADEIKTLADQAKEATSQVSSILGEIQKGINASVMSTEESVKRVATGRGQTESTLQSITALAETIEASVRAFDQIVASANQQRVGLEQVSEALSQIRSGSEQTAAGTRQIEQAVGNINALGAKLDHAMARYAV